MRSYIVRAANTAPDSENKIHDDTTAARYGFRGGLVPGVTVYGYLTVAALDHFGEAWLDRGTMSVRFREPVYDGEEVSVQAQLLDSGVLQIVLDSGRASGLARLEANGVPPSPQDDGSHPLHPLPAERPPASRETLAPGTVLGEFAAVLDAELARVTAPLSPWIGDRRLAHPATLLSLANQALIRNFTLGPWIHGSSEVANYSAVSLGEQVSVHARVAGLYERKGHEFVTLDVSIMRGRDCVQHVYHTAIWQPRYTENSGATA